MYVEAKIASITLVVPSILQVKFKEHQIIF